MELGGLASLWPAAAAAAAAFLSSCCSSCFSSSTSLSWLVARAGALA
jgi:hypothetical protein